MKAVLNNMLKVVVRSKDITLIEKHLKIHIFISEITFKWLNIN